MTKIELENLEKYYLNTIGNCVKDKRELFLDAIEKLQDLEPIWRGHYEDEQSIIAIGTERVFHNIFAKEFPEFNPCMNPVGSDILYETDDCYLHIDIKTVSSNNLGDVRRNIFVGNNQTSYEGLLDIGGSNSRSEFYEGCLPKYIDNKPVITLFLVAIYDCDSLDIISTFVTCMPNGDLNYVDILSAGKNPGKIRFDYKNLEFKNLNNNNSFRSYICYESDEYDFNDLGLNHLEY